MKKIILLLLSTFMLFSCAKKAEESKSVSGEFTGESTGFNGPIKLKTTITDNKIEKIEFIENYESFGVQRAINIITNEIIEQQSINLDVVTGATFATRGILSAVEKSLTEAGLDLEKYNTKYSRGELDSQKYEADVVVIGAGGAGMSAAVSAAQDGSKVIVIEKLGITGGSTIFSGGAYNAADTTRGQLTEMTDKNIAAINKLLEKEPNDEYEKKLQSAVKSQLEKHISEGNKWLFDSKELHALQTYSGGDYQGNPELIDVMVNNALDGVDWLESVGAKWEEKLGSATGSLWQRSHYGIKGEFPNGAPEILPAEKYIAENDNIELHLYTKAVKLVVEDGKIVGVKADNKGKEIEYSTKSVVIATGGFGANVEMREKYNEQWDNLGAGIGCSNQNPSAQGEGIILAEEVGANLVDMGLIQLHPNGEVGTGMMMGQPHTSGLNRIFVNNNGDRFVAEDSRRDVLVNAIYAQPEGNMWIIADGNRYPEGDDLIANYVTLNKTFKADTVEELAKMIGVNPENLQASIDAYNEVVDGKEDEFGLKTFDKKLGVAPFYAAKRIPTVHHTMGGIQINTNAEVLNTNGEVIKGLYAAGEVTGDIHGANRLGGNAIVDIVVFGRIAGQSASEYSK